MNDIRTMAVFAWLIAFAVSAGVMVDTNQMPSTVHGLMETSGHALATTNRVLTPPDTNSLRNRIPIPKSRLVILKPATTKSSWSFWDSAHVKYIGWNKDLLNALAPAHPLPYTALAQFEYDLTYSFDF